MGDQAWWYEWEGRQAGPVAEEALLELLRSRSLAPTARVWRAGMAGWEPAGRVAALAGALASTAPTPSTPSPSPSPTPSPTPTSISASTSTSSPTLTSSPTSTSTSTSTPTPSPTQPSSWAAAPSSAGYALPAGLEPVSLGAILGLGLVTLGIYPAVKFYQAGQAYQVLAGRPSRFTTWFWLSIALTLLGGPAYILGGVTGAMMHLAGLAFTVLTLFEALALRGEAVRRWAVAPVLTSDATHKALFVVGLLTSWLFVGVILLVVQAVKFFDDHRALGDAVRARAAAPRSAA